MYNQEKVDKFYPGAPVYKAMKFWSLPKKKLDMIEEICESGDYYGQTKKDGNWFAFSKSIDGTPYLFSRGESVSTGLPVEGIEKVPHIAEAFTQLPNDTVLLGELYYPGKTTAAVRSIMGCLPAKAKERQKEQGKIHYYLFDIIRYDGEDLTAVGSLKRYLKLKEIVETYELLSDKIELADCQTENLYSYLVENFKKGEEGSILKKNDAPYAEGKSPAWSSIKWKKKDDVDVVCMGFEEATKEYTGKEHASWEFWEVDGELKKGNYYNQEGAIAVTKPYYYGWKMSINFGLWNDALDTLVPIGSVSSGMNDTLRADAAKNEEDYIGKVMKLSYMELTDDAIREPVFIEFREDKMSKECKLSEVFR